MRKPNRIKNATLSTAFALSLLTTMAGPSSAMTPRGEDGGCVDYGKVVNAPGKFIPRDDMVTAKKDPLTTWVTQNSSKVQAAVTAQEKITVPVAFHVIRKNNTLSGGNVPDSQIADQITVMNNAFASSGFAFELVETTRTTKPQWFNLIYTQGGEPRFFRGSSKEIKMKRALSSRDSETLDIYSSALGKFLLGYAYFPSDFVGDNPLPRFFDGVVIDYRSMPGGAYTVYNGGDTATHEIGHWLELFHTFSGGCTEPGDRVEDTPYEASPAFRCPVGRDTCEAPGLDPITNFMDYTYDDCMNEFTNGQAERMQTAWTAFRAQ